MASVTRYAASNSTLQSQTSATLTEVAAYAVSWATLSGAGFADGDQVVVICRQTVTGELTNMVASGVCRAGADFATGTPVPGSEFAIEGEDTSSIRGHHHTFFFGATLATGGGIFFGIAGDGTNDCRANDWSILVLNLSDLAAGDWRYADATHSGNAPIAYNTAGATVTVPGNASNNDWLLLAGSQFLVDDNSSTMLTALSWGGTDYGEVAEIGSDVAEIRSFATSRYVTGITSDTTLRARFRTNNGASHDASRTAVFALRLSAFRDHDGAVSTTAITHSVLDTYQECNGLPTYSHGGGDLIVWAQSRPADYQETTKSMYGRVQVGGVDFITTLGRNGGAKPHGTDDYIPWTYLGMVTTGSGTLDIDVDIAEDSDVTPTYDADYHVLAAFSAELAGGGAGPTPPLIGGRLVGGGSLIGGGGLVHA